MAIVRLLGVEHLPSGVGVGTVNTCYGLSQADLGAAAFWNADTTTYPQIAHLRVEGSALQFGGRKEAMAGHGAGTACISLSKLMGAIDPNKLIIGFRCTRLGVPESQIPLFALDTTQFGTGGIPGNQLIVINPTDALTGNYYELVFDFTTGKYDVYRDEIVITAQATIPAAITKTTIKNYNWLMGRYDVYHVPGGTDIKLFALQDIYVIADLGIAGDNAINRMGPIVVRRAGVVSTTGNGYTPTSGWTIGDAVTARRNAGALISPCVAAPADRTPLRAKLKTADLAGTVIKGLYVGAAAFRDSGVTDGVTAKVSLNAVDSTPVALANLTTATPFDQRVFSGTKAPDGTKLDLTSLANLEIVFTPTA